MRRNKLVKVAVSNWRVYQSANGERFVIGRADSRIFGPAPLGKVKLVGPPRGDDMVSYYFETGWNADRDARDVTDEAWSWVTDLLG